MEPVRLEASICYRLLRLVNEAASAVIEEKNQPFKEDTNAFRSGIRSNGARFRPFSTYQVRLEDNPQIPQTKYSHTGHDECCVCRRQPCQRNSRRAAYAATDSHSVAQRMLRRRPSARVQGTPYRGEWYPPLNGLGSHAID